MAVPVVVTTVLESVPATISDLSEHGARLAGIDVPHGEQLRIDCGGQTLFARSRWSEVDRTGIEFLEELTHGPLFDQLQATRAAAAQAARDNDAELALAFAQDSVVNTEGTSFSKLKPCRCLSWHSCAKHGPQAHCLRFGGHGRRDAA